MDVVIIVGCICLFWVSLMFRGSAMIMAHMFMSFLHLLKWVVVLGFVSAFISMPQLYAVMGWTPASVIFGPQIYDRSMRELKLKQY